MWHNGGEDLTENLLIITGFNNRIFPFRKYEGAVMSRSSPYTLGGLTLANRMVNMALITRCRAVEGNIPGPLSVTYYRE